MLNKDLVDVAYDFTVDYLKKHRKEKTTLDFSEISKGTQKIIGMSDGEFSKLLGSLYVDLLQDGRFVYLGNPEGWTLKDLISLESYNKNQNSLYNYENGTPFTEVYDEDALPEEMVNEDNEVYEENENEVSRDSFENDVNSELEYDDDEVVSEAEKDDDIVDDDSNEIEDNDDK